MDLRDAQAVFFDVDDTLYDFDASMALAFEHLQGAFPDVLGPYPLERISVAYHTHYRKIPETTRIELIHQDPDLFRRTMWAGALAGLGLDEDAERRGWLRARHPEVASFGHPDGFARIVTDEFTRLRPVHWRKAMYAGAAELLRELKGKRVLGVITNGPGPVQRPKLQAFSYRDHFPEELVFVSGEFGRRKPEPAIFLAAARAAGVAPRDCVMVGDSRQHDMPAKAVGFRTILFHGPRPDTVEDGGPWPPDAVASSHGELRRLLL